MEYEYPVIVPAAPVPPAVPRGAAVLGAGDGLYLVCSDMLAPFGERCALAARDGRAVAAGLLEGVTVVGWFSDGTGEVRLDERRGPGLLGQWIGHRVFRDDLLARGTPSGRRRRAAERGAAGRPGGSRWPGREPWL